MDGALSIADSAINANQTEIAVTSENVANAQTPGYAAETANLATLPASGLAGIGSGVEVASISQAKNLMLQLNNLQAQGALSNLNSLQQVMTGIQNIFPIGQSSSSSSSTTTTNTGLAGQLANFWNAWDAVAQDPSGTASRTEVINLAQGIATTMQESSVQLDQLSANGVTQLQDAVGQVNSLLGQVGNLNGAIAQTEGAGGNASTIEDQLQGVLGQLAQLGGISVHYASDNTATVTLGGVALVQEGNVAQVSLDQSGGIYSLQANPGAVPLGVSSGSIAGLLAGLNQYIPQYQNELNGVANSLITTVNTQLGAGFTASGAAGGPLFSGTDATNIGVVAAVAANPALLAAASTSGPAGANDGSNAQVMAEFASSQTGADSRYQNLIQSVGSALENVNTQVSAQGAVANQAQSALQSATGVNLDSELTNLMNFQANYQASAKLLSVIDQTMQSLIQAVA